MVQKIRNFSIMLNNLIYKLKTASKKAIQKKAEKANDFIGNEIADKITKVLSISPQNGSEKVERETEN